MKAFLLDYVLDGRLPGRQFVRLCPAARLRGGIEHFHCDLEEMLCEMLVSKSVCIFCKKHEVVAKINVE